MADTGDRPALRALLVEVAARAADYRESLAGRPVAPQASFEELCAALGGPLPDGPSADAEVIARLAQAAEPGLMGMGGPRFFGFVIGGAVPAAIAADVLTTAWDQNAGLSTVTPAAAAAETVAATWLADLLGLPADVSCGFVTGGQMANFACLAAARDHVLRAVGWDVEADGLAGAPEVRVYVGAERHETVDVALRYLGLGARRSVIVDVDDQGRMRSEALAHAMTGYDGPAIVCAQAGNVNTGALDPVGAIVDVAEQHDAWVHVDGAFGLWAAAAPDRRHLLVGHERADSWATDAHKWLNVPYDAGLAFTRHPPAHRAALSISAAYLPSGAGGGNPSEFVPELSRRARGFTVWAALAALGRSGVADLVERCCALARRFAEDLRGVPGVAILNDVALNQVLVRFGSDLDAASGDALTRDVVERIQREGTCWVGTTTWRGSVAMRISVSNATTTAEDVTASTAAMRRCLADAMGDP